MTDALLSILFFCALATLPACLREAEKRIPPGYVWSVTLLHTSDIHSKILPFQYRPNRFDEELGLRCAVPPGVLLPKEDTNEVCNDGVDNDGNGYLDCNDFGCSRNAAVTVCKGPQESGADACANEIDDDGDGLTDCDDPACANDPNVEACPCPNGPFGGAARVATVVRCERGDFGYCGHGLPQRAFYLNSGDTFQGAPIFNYFYGEAEVRSLAAMGLRAMALGNHEFDMGAESVAMIIDKWATFPVLACNYLFEDPTQYQNNSLGYVIEPYTTLYSKGATIGVVGVGNRESLISIDEYGNSLGVIPLETVPAVQEMVDFVRPQVDLVVVLSHLGLNYDQELVRRTQGIDIILGGHNHIMISPVLRVRDQDGREVLILHSGSDAKFVSRIDLTVLDGEIIAHQLYPIPIDPSVPEDPKVSYLLDDYKLEMDKMLTMDDVIGYAKAEILRASPRGTSSPLGNMVARAMRERQFVETDFVMTNSLGIRANIPAGKIRLGKMYEVFPFENSITTMFLSGYEVLDLFDYAARRSAERGCKSQVQIAGARVELSCYGQSVVRENAGGRSLPRLTIGGSLAACRQDAECAAGEICIGGKCGLRLNLNLAYELATNDYMANGGSGFYVLDRNTTKADTGISLRTAVTDFIRQSSPIDPAQYEDECIVIK